MEAVVSQELDSAIPEIPRSCDFIRVQRPQDFFLERSRNDFSG
jgi:hypothetical protein